MPRALRGVRYVSRHAQVSHLRLLRRSAALLAPSPSNRGFRFTFRLKYLAYVAAGLVAWYILRPSSNDYISWSAFCNLVLSKSIARISVTSPDRDPRVVVTTHSGSSHVMPLPSIDTFEDELDALQDDAAATTVVRYRHGAELSTRVIHALVTVGIFALLLRMFGREPAAFQQMRGLMGPREHKFEVIRGHTTKFSDVAGCSEAKVEIMEIVDFLKNRTKYEDLGARIPRGALLVGPPGTGKTLLAKATAAESGVPFINCAGSDFVEMIVGVGPKRVRELFALARRLSPCIVFIDEIDAVGRQRGEGARLGMRNDERENTLNQLLVELDGFESSSGVVVLAGTNRADILDKALKRPGRFDRQIALPLPALADRESIFAIHLGKVKLDEGIEVGALAGKLAALTPGMSGADIANVCNLAALTAARTGEKVGVQLDDFTYAIERVLAGSAKEDRILAVDEKRRVATHSAAQVVYQWLSPYSDPVLRVSIIPRGGEKIGFTQLLPKERFITTKAAIFDRMVSKLVGVIAERELVGGRSTRSQKALEAVTNDAIGWVCVYGFSWDVGHVHFTGLQEQRATSPYSDATQRLVDAVVTHVVDSAHRHAELMFAKQRSHVESVAEALMSKEALGDEELKELLPPRPPLLAEMAGESIGTFSPSDYAAHLASWKEHRSAEAEVVRAALRQLSSCSDSDTPPTTNAGQLGGSTITAADVASAVAEERERSARDTARNDVTAWLAASAACASPVALVAAISTLCTAAKHSPLTAAALCYAASSAAASLPPAACIALSAQLREWSEVDVAHCGRVAEQAAARLEGSAVGALALFAQAAAMATGSVVPSTVSAKLGADSVAGGVEQSLASSSADGVVAPIRAHVTVPSDVLALSSAAADVAHTLALVKPKASMDALVGSLAELVCLCVPPAKVFEDARHRAPTQELQRALVEDVVALERSVNVVGRLWECVSAPEGSADTAPSSWGGCSFSASALSSSCHSVLDAVRAVNETLSGPAMLPDGLDKDAAVVSLARRPTDERSAHCSFEDLLAMARLSIAAATVVKASCAANVGDVDGVVVSAVEVVCRAADALGASDPPATHVLTPTAAVMTAQLLAAARMRKDQTIDVLADIVDIRSSSLTFEQLAALLEALAAVGASDELIVPDAARALMDSVNRCGPADAANLLWAAAVLRATCAGGGDHDAGRLEEVSSLVTRLTQRITMFPHTILSQQSAARVYVACTLTADLVGGLSLPSALVTYSQSAWQAQQQVAQAQVSISDEPGAASRGAVPHPASLTTPQTSRLVEASLDRLGAVRARGASSPWALVVDWKGAEVAVVGVGAEHLLVCPEKELDGEMSALVLYLKRQGWRVASVRSDMLVSPSGVMPVGEIDVVVREVLDRAVSGGV